MTFKLYHAYDINTPLMWLATLLVAHLTTTVLSCTPITPLNIHGPSIALIPVTLPPTTTTPPAPELVDYHDDVLRTRATDPERGTIKHPNDDDVPLQHSAMELKRDQALPPVERAPRLLPSLFDLFRPLNLHSWTANSLPALSAEKDVHGIRNPKFLMVLSPPVSWTFCEPLCGIGDQAVDTDDAKENASEDIKQALVAAFERAHLHVPADSQVVVQYDPKSTMIDEFGEFFDRTGYRYQLRGLSVAYKVHRNATNVPIPHTVELSAKLISNQSIRVVDAERVAREVYQLLSLVGAYFAKPVEVVAG
ncbi:hypothetical protein Y032_0028g1798 [Ancylostoma ceylanicum]|uniref:Uncharacterized protein n=2 Tax=Ancylostoma ceylanicum TaxID=53326 RepID=A0A016USB6_9BILA|nr:hypothetical protein Y032_0028g1798 [Ancylostoma ceylanicum]